MNPEAEFNESAAKEFADELLRVTGRQLRFKRTGAPFPDAILETTEGQPIGVEFVSVVLPFIRPEEEDFRRYRHAFYEALRKSRPRYRNFAIRLQPARSCIEGKRPFRLPGAASSQGKTLIKEFGDLLSKHLTEMLPNGCLLSKFDDAFPALSKYYGAIILNEITERYPGRSHPYDPVIESPVIVYRHEELLEAVLRSVLTKEKKSRSYSTDILLLHTLTPQAKNYMPAMMPDMDAETIARRATAILRRKRDFSQRFNEVWFLNAYADESGKRLYPIKAPSHRSRVNR